jgi:hypothetical protein
MLNINKIALTYYSRPCQPAFCRRTKARRTKKRAGTGGYNFSLCAIHPRDGSLIYLIYQGN